MFDIGFLELIVIGITALLVLGPERLPAAARTAGKYFGKARRLATKFSTEVDRQLEIDELKEQLKEQGQLLDINKDIQAIKNVVQGGLTELEQSETLSRGAQTGGFSSPIRKVAND